MEVKFSGRYFLEEKLPPIRTGRAAPRGAEVSDMRSAKNRNGDGSSVSGKIARELLVGLVLLQIDRATDASPKQDCQAEPKDEVTQPLVNTVTNGPGELLFIHDEAGRTNPLAPVVSETF